MAKQVLDVHPGKGMTLMQSNEHLRVAFKGAYLARLSGNFDPTREHLNFEVTKGGIVTPLNKGNSIPKRIKQSLKKRGIKDPNIGMAVPKYRTVANIIIGGSREQMHRLAYGEQKVDLDKGANNIGIKRCPEIEKWAIDMYKFMSNKYGEENIAAFIVHLDETNPHIHCTLLPVVDNKLSWRKFWVGDNNDKRMYRKTMLQLHDELSTVNAKYGLERGEDITRTLAKHRSTAEYRADLAKKLQAENISLAEEITKQRNVKAGLQKDIVHASARLKALTTMLGNLEQRKIDLQDEIVGLEKKLADGKISNEEFEKNMAVLKENLAQCEVNIVDKQEKLKLAQEKLDALMANISKKEEKLDELKNQEKSSRAGVNRSAFLTGQAMQLNEAVVDQKARVAAYQENLKQLTPEQRSFVESVNKPLFAGESTISELAQDGTDIAAIATNLFLGYLNNATAISQSGGGGSGPTSGWGRDKDEDDYDYWRRCFGMARSMRRGRGRKR